VSDVPNTPARPVLPGELDKAVSMREFEQRMFAMQQLMNDRIRAERELVETRSNALDKALELAAKETERRLEELNHAHANAVDNWRRSLPREVFEATVIEWSKWRDLVNVHVTTLTAIPQTITGIDARVSAIEKMSNKLMGAFILLGLMGLSGVLALILGLARLGGLLR
jgi:hypothetical protein